MNKTKTFFAASLFLFSFSHLHAQLATLPFEFRGNQLYIKVQVKDNDTLNFIFDTGSTGTSIDSAIAEKIDIDRKNRTFVSVAGSGGSQVYTMAPHQNLKLSGVELEDINLVLTNFNSLSNAIGFRMDGIIGYDIMKNYVTQLDFDRKQLSLYHGIKNIDTTGYTAIPFEFNKNVLIPRFPVSLVLNNGESFTGRAMFDTGNAFPLIVSTGFSKYHNFSSKLGETSMAVGRGANTTTKDLIATIKAMSFNGFNFGKMGIRLTVNDQAIAYDGYLGILGIQIIKRFNVILDYSRKKIYLKPNQAYYDEFKLEQIKYSSNAASRMFLEKNKGKPGIKTTLSGLQYKILRQGKGPIPNATDRVTLSYTASQINGLKLWSTYDNNKPWVHHLDKAIDGLREAVLMMPVGSKWILFIPASLAFGDSGFEQVKPGAALMYEVELLKTEK